MHIGRWETKSRWNLKQWNLQIWSFEVQSAFVLLLIDTLLNFYILTFKQIARTLTLYVMNNSIEIYFRMITYIVYN